MDLITSSSAVALVGPTASGKTQLAINLARKFDFLELVSIDSMTIYRSMNIGTAKPSASDLGDIKYHLIDLVDPWEEYSVSRFQSDAREVISGISSRHGVALLVGGTGLYYSALVDELAIPGNWPKLRNKLEMKANTEEGRAALYEQLVNLDPIAASKILPNNSRRIVRALEVTLGSGLPFSAHGPGLFSSNEDSISIVGIQMDRIEMFDRIEARLDLQIEQGWLSEVERLINDPRGLSRTARQALGYKELISVLMAELTLEEARAMMLSRTKKFAKRQIAWFKRDARISWFSSPHDAETALASIISNMVKSPS